MKSYLQFKLVERLYAMLESAFYLSDFVFLTKAWLTLARVSKLYILKIYYIFFIWLYKIIKELGVVGADLLSHNSIQINMNNYNYVSSEG